MSLGIARSQETARPRMGPKDTRSTTWVRFRDHFPGITKIEASALKTRKRVKDWAGNREGQVPRIRAMEKAVHVKLRRKD